MGLEEKNRPFQYEKDWAIFKQPESISFWYALWNDANLAVIDICEDQSPTAAADERLFKSIAACAEVGSETWGCVGFTIIQMVTLTLLCACHANPYEWK